MALKRRLFSLGKVEQYILDKIRNDGAIHITLLDPDKYSGSHCANIAKEAEQGYRDGL